MSEQEKPRPPLPPFDATTAAHNWFRSYGNENWEFDEHGFMRRRIASINDRPIHEGERKYRWPLGRGPDDHPSLSELDL